MKLQLSFISVLSVGFNGHKIKASKRFESPLPRSELEDCVHYETILAIQ